MKRSAATTANLFAHLAPAARERGHDNWGLRASGCGPCEAARFGLMDLSGLTGGGR